MKQYTEQEIKSMVTPEIIKKMVELAEGFRYGSDIDGDFIHYFGYDYIIENIFEWDAFPLLIHRAVEGWNKKQLDSSSGLQISIDDYEVTRLYWDGNNDRLLESLPFKNYQKENLTQLELALLHCMIEILKEDV